MIFLYYSCYLLFYAYLIAYNYLKLFEIYIYKGLNLYIKIIVMDANLAFKSKLKLLHGRFKIKSTPTPTLNLTLKLKSS